MIRNQLVIDEGDPYNDILAKDQKIILKVLIFLKILKQKFLMEKTKIKNHKYLCRRKTYWRNFCRCGAGTGGGTAMFGVKKKYLGKVYQ